MQLSHTHPVAGAVFDDPNLVSAAGLVPVVALAQRCRLGALADGHLSVPSDKGANAGRKVMSLVAGMVAGADSIDDMALLRHGAMGTIFDHPYAPSTLGSFLRAFTFTHVRQLDAVAARVLSGLAETTPVLTAIDDLVFVDVDDTIIKVHGHSKQGSGYGYSGVRGLNTLLATVTTASAAPVIVAQRLRKGACGSPRGAARLVADALAALARLRATDATGTVLLRADSAFYGHPTVAAAIRAGAQVSVTVRLDPKVKKAIASIPEDAWAPIAYTDAVFDEATHSWISRAEVAEIGFTAFSSKKPSQQVPGRLVVRRIPDLNRLLEGLEPDAALLELAHGLDEVRQGPPEPVESPHRQGVPRPQRRHHLGQLRSIGLGARRGVGPRPPAPRGAESVVLQRSVLHGRRHPRVPQQLAHEPAPCHNPPTEPLVTDS